MIARGFAGAMSFNTTTPKITTLGIMILSITIKNASDIHHDDTKYLC